MKKLFGAQSICKVNERGGRRSDALEGTGAPRLRIPALPPVCSHPPPKKKVLRGGSFQCVTAGKPARYAGLLFPSRKQAY